MAPFRSLVDVFAVLQPVLPYFVVYCMLIVRPHFPHDTIFEYIYNPLKLVFLKKKGVRVQFPQSGSERRLTLLTGRVRL